MDKRRRYIPDLASDMAECDANYIRLYRLFPRMSQDEQVEFGVEKLAQKSNLGERGLAGESVTDTNRLSMEPAAKALPDVVRGETNDGAIVTIEIEERCPYTTMLKVNVSDVEDKPWVKWPTLQVRVYHDICSAEVISFERHRNFKYRYQTPNQNMFQPDEKSQINKYFGELLKYCFENGHSLEKIPVF